MAVKAMHAVICTQGPATAQGGIGGDSCGQSLWMCVPMCVSGPPVVVLFEWYNRVQGASMFVPLSVSAIAPLASLATSACQSAGALKKANIRSRSWVRDGPSERKPRQDVQGCAGA